MEQTKVGIRELKENLSKYMAKVKSGQSIVITEHGKPVGRIIPEGQCLEERVEALVQAGVIAWSGKKLKRIKPPAVNRSDKLVSDIVIEMRE
ncbi:MAG: type II toxin-antitoxin system prevent-host-death family antitoxin [Anaerolineales bacterium]|nr:type II toxin-antitoxin system prevent-host-death family antitoxin [Anaerolineales bacterium]